MNKEEIKAITLKLESDIQNIQSSLKKLKEDIRDIEEGDGVNPYWSGDRAHQAVKTALLQVEHNTGLLEDLENKVGFIHSLVK